MFSNESVSSVFTYVYDGIEINSEKSVRLLGVEIDNKLNFSEHV